MTIWDILISYTFQKNSTARLERSRCFFLSKLVSTSFFSYPNVSSNDSSPETMQCFVKSKITLIRRKVNTESPLSHWKKTDRIENNYLIPDVDNGGFSLLYTLANPRAFMAFEYNSFILTIMFEQNT